MKPSYCVHISLPSTFRSLGAGRSIMGRAGLLSAAMIHAHSGGFRNAAAEAA